MSKTKLFLFVFVALLFSARAFAIDGQLLINQSTVEAAGGFPYIINEPGSYKLSGNLVVPAGETGILIRASNVTVDLNGFTISGPVACTGAGASISCVGVGGTYGISAISPNITIRNGSVIGFITGIDLQQSNNLVEEIHATGNGAFGIYVLGGVVRRNTGSLNGITGIGAANSTVTENIANSNGYHGLGIGPGGVFGSNTFEGNGAGGVFAVSAVSQENNDCDGSAC
jgi:hypothetical protein